VGGGVLVFLGLVLSRLVCRFCLVGLHSLAALGAFRVLAQQRAITAGVCFDQVVRSVLGSLGLLGPSVLSTLTGTCTLDEWFDQRV
jgi:hypothetical protein